MMLLSAKGQSAVRSDKVSLTVSMGKKIISLLYKPQTMNYTSLLFTLFIILNKAKRLLARFHQPIFIWQFLPEIVS